VKSTGHQCIAALIATGCSVLLPLHSVATDAGDVRTSYSSEHYVVGKGQGDLSKGKIVCQRVSELTARTDLAKQIRILVKEHMVDRVRERTGREVEQDIELTREEIVQEYLQGVKIVDRRIDEEGKTCSAIAVMLKNQIQPKQAPDAQDTSPKP
jgi:predicted Zn-dependent protease with MMP-like domain